MNEEIVMQSTLSLTRRYRCSRGHEWSVGASDLGLHGICLQIDDKPMPTFCTRCIAGLLEANAGKVEQVSDADVPMCVEKQP